MVTGAEGVMGVFRTVVMAKAVHLAILTKG